MGFVSDIPWRESPFRAIVAKECQMGMEGSAGAIVELCAHILSRYNRSEDGNEAIVARDWYDASSISSNQE
jgi:hypothetical protein